MSVLEFEKMSKGAKGDDRSQYLSKLKLAMASFQEYDSLNLQEPICTNKTEKLHSSNLNASSLFNGSEHDDSTVWTHSKGSYEVEESKFEDTNSDFHINLINLKPAAVNQASKDDKGFSDDDLQSIMWKRISGTYPYIIQIVTTSYILVSG